MTPQEIRSPAELQAVMRAAYPVSDEQWAAVSAPLEPAVVIAGAGSGKTTLMAARVVYLVATGQVRPEEVLGLTFTTKAAAELRSGIRTVLERADLLQDPDVAGADDEAPERLEPTVSTYNAYAAALLSEQGLRIGHEPDTRLMADASRYQLAARAVQRHRGRVEHLTESPSHVVTYLLGLEGALSEHLVTPDDVRRWQAHERPLFEEAVATERAKADLKKVLEKMSEREELLGLVEDYRALKADLGVMDFSDQIALAARLAGEFPEVGEAQRATYRVVLLDEYQDTSVAQARLLGALFSGPDQASGRGHAVTAVGDPHQAIYGWRGASVANLTEIGQTFPAGDGGEPTRYELTVSRRCDRRILEVANHLAGPLADPRHPVRELRAAPEAGEGRVRASLHPSSGAELAALPAQVRAAQAEIAEQGRDGTWRHIGVLTRDNQTAAEVFAVLTADDIKVEIVGLSGLLRLPEVAEVVATLTLLHDLTANAELLTLLSGPRWAIGPRDLALLGRRARDLAGHSDRTDPASLSEELSQAVSGADPTELLSLSDALADPGELPYSPAARERFALLAGELRMLRRYAGEPLLDLVRLIIDTCGIDLELASSVSESASARRDNLDLFVKAVAEFSAVDGDVTLPALLAYLTAEDELGTGLDIATPTESDSVKLLTVHRAKGLEWHSVFLAGMAEKKFPTERTRSTWLTGSFVIPSDLRGDAATLPRLGERTAAGLKQFKADTRDHEALEERRLGYVAVTRAERVLAVSSYWRRYRGQMIGPSPYQLEIVAVLEGWGEAPDPWCPEPEDDLLDQPVPAPWPVSHESAEATRRAAAAALVGDASADDPELDVLEAARVAEWDTELERLVVEARAERTGDVAVPLPSSLSATALARLREDPAGFARELARPMPRPPSAAARFGTRFHAWVEARFGQQDLFDYSDLPGRGDAGIDDDTDLAELTAAFAAGPFGSRTPHQVEAPFALVLGGTHGTGQVVRGRIDAVYTEPDGTFLLVDWKTNRAPTADPLQLGIYRLAWAELHGLPVEQVRAAFYYVRTGDLVEPADLPGRTELEALLDDPGGPS